MVAYSFKRYFVEPIRGDAKLHTIRGDRRRHARPGEEMQLYCGMRTRSCFLVARRICRDVQPIVLELRAGTVAIGTRGSRVCYWRPAELDRFARSDGFQDWPALVDFWRAEHGPAAAFAGVILFWHPGGNPSARSRIDRPGPPGSPSHPPTGVSGP